MVNTTQLLPIVKQVESGGNPMALSPKGAAGAYQIMPATAANPGYGVTPLQGWDGQDPRTADPAEQERFARDYLQAMSALHGGDVKLALASYNAGPGAVQMAGNTVPNYPETQNYVNKITQGANVANTSVTPGNVATDWRTRAQPVEAVAAPITSDWRTRAQPVTSATTSDWRTRAQPVPPEASVVETPAQPPSVAEDVTKSVGSNLAKGAVDALMILPNLANQAVAGPQYLYEGLIGQDRKDFQPYQPFYSSDDVTDNSMIDYKPQTTEGKVAGVAARLGANIATPSAVNKVANKVSPGVRPTAADRKATSQLKYDQVDKSGAVLDDTVFQDFVNKAAQIRPQGRIQKATGSVDKFDEALAEVQKVSSVKDMTISEVKQLDERLTNLAEGARGAMGAGTPESRLINQLKHTWRSTVEDAADKGLVTVTKNGQKVNDPAAVEAWKGAVKDYATANRAKDIELIIKRAKMTDNPASAIKTGMRNLALKIEKGQARGYTKEQIKAINQAAETGISTGIARVVGSRLNPIVALSSTGIDAGLTAGVASKAARDFATKAQTNRAEKVLDLLLGKPTKDPQTAAWAKKNSGAARKASVANMLGASEPRKEKK